MSDGRIEKALRSKRLSSGEAGYMELRGAKKDGDCEIVDVTGGISLRKGCCNEFKPQSGADEFRCGECVHSRRK